MAPSSVNPADWFLADRQNPHSSLSLFTSGNLVEALIDGKNYMDTLHVYILACKQNDYLFLAGWRLDSDQQLIKGDVDSKISNFFPEASGRGVAVRLLLSSHATTTNIPVHRYFRKAMFGKGIQSVLDQRIPTYGSHHQKFACISQNGKLYAFCGGIDLAEHRRDDRTHSDGGWHDIQTFVQGPACRDLDATFRERWNDPTRPNMFDTSPSPITLPVPATPAIGSGTHHVQILRTYACGYADGIGYPFAPQGECSTRRACLQAIGLARDLIYIEDQYFVSYEIAKAIRDALCAQPSLRVIVVMPRFQLQWARSFHFHQLNLLSKLSSVAPNHFACYHLDNPNRLGEQIYVHCKSIIVDDVWVKIGSSNLSRRDSSHDSQVDVAVVDGTIVDGVCKFARDLRLELWAEHLALIPSDPRLVDPVIAFNLWKTRAGTAGVPAQVHVESDPHGSESLWDVVDPQKLCAGEPRLADTDLAWEPDACK